MRIAVMGTGAMACLFGGRLAATGNHTVWLIGQWHEQIDAIRTRGLTFTELDDTQRHVTLQATTDPADVLAHGGPVDVALVLVKSYGTSRAAPQAARVLAADGLAVTLQNGLGNLEVLAGALGRSRCAAGVTNQGATVLAPGHVRHTGRGDTFLSPPPAPGPEQVQALAATFTRAGLPTQVVDDVQTLQWSKLVVNVAINPLTALLRVRNGVLADIPACRTLVARAVHEAVAVATALGIRLAYDDPLTHVLRVAQATAVNRSSMLMDVLRGAPTEVEAINGAVVREGSRRDVSTPFNDALCALIKGLEATADVRLPEKSGTDPVF